MFKKKPTIKPAAPLRSSDRRKLADKIIQNYSLEPPTLPGEPEQAAETAAARSSLRNSLLPDNVQVARFTTTHGPDLKPVSGNVYIGSREGEEQRVLWFELESRMHPTIYTLWHNPGLVALLHTPGIVVTKLQGGADLMTPGLAAGPPFPTRAEKGAIVAVASTDTPAVPVAVGVCDIDVSSLGSVRGAKGRAVENMHWLGDELWNYSPTGRSPPQAPLEVEGWAKLLAVSNISRETEGLILEENGDDETGGVSLHPSATQEKQRNETGKEVLSMETEEIKPWSQKDIDAAFRSAFLYGVYHHKMTQTSTPNHGLEFPLSQSFVMATLIQPFLPTFTAEDSQQLQIKKSSWKNVKKFIKSLDKEKIIKSKEKDGHEVVVIDIDFDDQVIANFKPYRLPKKTAASTASTSKAEKVDHGTEPRDDAIGQKLQVLSLYRPASKLSALFADASKSVLMAAEVRELVSAYVEKEQLVSESNKRLVKLDPLLGNAVFDGSAPLDREVISKGIVPRDALIDRILRAMSPAYAIIRNETDPASVKPKTGTLPKIHITLETRSGNKTVTKVSGLEPYFIHPRLLADELRKTCAGSTSVEPLAGAAKKTEREVLEVMIQGPQKETVIKALEKRGVDKRWVEFMDKTKGKKR